MEFATRVSSKLPSSGPRTGYYSDIIEEAAALWESLSQNHPFIDGNKRTAFGALCALLGANNAHLRATQQEAMSFVTGLYDANNFRFDQLVPWLRQYVDLRPQR